jgi:hypothetical protein
MSQKTADRRALTSQTSQHDGAAIRPCPVISAAVSRKRERDPSASANAGRGAVVLASCIRCRIGQTIAIPCSTLTARLRPPRWPGFFLRRDLTKHMMSALASLMGRASSHSQCTTRARSHQPGSFHLLFSISRAPWRSSISSSGYRRA